MKKHLFILAIFVIGLTNTSLKAQCGWTPQTNPLGSGAGIIGQIQFVSSSEGWINVTVGPKLLHTTNAGNEWSVVTLSPDDTVRTMSNPCVNISFINPTTGWVIKGFGTNFSNLSGGIVYKTTDGGNNWQRNVISQNTGEFGFQIQFIDVNNGWASVSNVNTLGGSLYKSTNGGNDWNLISTELNGIFYFIDINNGWTINVNPYLPPPYQIQKTTNGGISWTTQFNDTTQGCFNAIQFIDSNIGWVVGNNSKILKTTNGGANWNYITNTGMSSTYSSMSFFFINADIGWIGTKDTSSKTVSILHTTDNGSSWTQQDPSTSGSSIYSIHFYDTLNGGLTSSQGRIFHTNTGGETCDFVRDGKEVTPNIIKLNQNYPNPFNPTTRISFQIGNYGFVSLKVFNLLGQEVATLVSEKLQPGEYQKQWNATGMPSGVYYYQLRAGNYIETRKLVLLR